MITVTFGKRIAESLSEVKDITIIIAGRNSNKAEKLCQALSLNGANALLQSAVIDIYQATFVDELKSLFPDIIIHTGGPFQGQNDNVPQACISKR